MAINLNHQIDSLNSSGLIGITFLDTSAITLPAGTIAQRPSATDGMIRFNSENNKVEFYYSGGWKDALVGSLTMIEDADGDTKIEVEPTPDGDYISFSTGDSISGYGPISSIMELSSAGFILGMGTAADAATNGAPVTISSGEGNTSGNGGYILISSGSSPEADGGAIQIISGNGGTSTSGNGGILTLSAGYGNNGNGGNTTITSGNAFGTSVNGGSLGLFSGNGGDTSGDSGFITIGAGSVTDGNGGSISILAGDAIGTSNIGGTIVLDAGSADSPSDYGQIQLRIATNNRLIVSDAGVGINAAPSNPLDVVDFGATTAISQFSRTSDTSGPLISLYRARSGAAPVQDDDTLGGLLFVGLASGPTFPFAASITAEVDGIPGSNDMPGRLIFAVTADGSSTPTEALRITNDKNASFAANVSTTKLLSILGNSSGAGELRIYEDSDNGSNYISIFAPATLSGNVSFVLPDNDGDNNDVLVTDGNGNLSWSAPSGGGATLTDDTSTNSSYYPTMASTTSGTFSTAYVSSTKFYFNPSTGRTSSTEFQTLSDANEKENIRNISDALEIINNINGVRFDWKNSNYSSAGLIAQEVEKYLPELVNNSPNNNKTLNYNGVIGVLVEAIKDLSAQLTELRKRIK